MKWLICLWLGISGATSVQQVVEEFHALQTERAELGFITKYKNSKNVSVQAYVFAVQMKQAEYSMNPVTKITIFRKYKNHIDNLIKRNPTNVHARYMRLVIQEKMPSILGYNSHIAKDKNLLLRYFTSSDKSKYLVKFIKKNTTL